MTTELAVPKGHGLVRVAHGLRRHVYNPLHWATEPGTDFWLLAQNAEQLTAEGGVLIENAGWTTTTLAHSSHTGGDLLSSATVGTPNSFLLGADTHLLP